MCRRKPVRHPFDLMAASIWRETMYGKWLILAAALIGAGSAEAQGLVGYAGPPVQVYDRPAPPCGPDCIINTLADADRVAAIVRQAALLRAPARSRRRKPQGRRQRTVRPRPRPAPPNQPDALDEIPTKPLVSGGITRMEIQAALVDWCRSGHANQPLCVKLRKRSGEQ